MYGYYSRKKTVSQYAKTVFAVMHAQADARAAV